MDKLICLEQFWKYLSLQLNSEKNIMCCQRIALFVAIFGSLLSSQINGSTLPPPVDEITNKTTIASNGEFLDLWHKMIGDL